MKSILRVMCLCLAMPVLAEQEDKKPKEDVSIFLKAGVVTTLVGSFIWMLYIAFDDHNN